MLKVSGEALAGDKGFGLDQKTIDEVASKIKDCYDMGVEIAIVVGGGNFWRGRSGEGMDRSRADHMGMLATVINSIYLKDSIERAGVGCEVMTAVSMSPFAKPYSAEEAVSALQSGKAVVFGAGLGIPFLSTDTAGAVRASEIGADAMLMAKNVDYIYTDDPRKNPNAKRIEHIKASEVLSLNLKAIDATATAFCMSVGMPIRVFGLREPEDILKAIRGESLGTVISPE